MLPYKRRKKLDDANDSSDKKDQESDLFPDLLNGKVYEPDPSSDSSDDDVDYEEERNLSKRVMSSQLGKKRELRQPLKPPS